ncbi:hypothetical protein PsYK624_065070 [Phanerochaete sordida]|uniref:Uncharacterized protein n=1 Tax=Phanerochaete sordida TaxID=48140 RepID=A0A9P3G8W8_9APHY|nr:hypothetical protein PsYK624_065070 [Phanerochaete sordida]
MGLLRSDNWTGVSARPSAYTANMVARKVKIEEFGEEVRNSGHGPSTSVGKGKKRTIEPRAKEDPADKDKGVLADDEASPSPHKRQRSGDDQGRVRQGLRMEDRVAEPFTYKASSRVSSSRKEQHIAAFRASAHEDAAAASTSSAGHHEEAAQPAARASTAARVTLPSFADAFRDVPRLQSNVVPQAQRQDPVLVQTPAPAVAPPVPGTNKMGINFILHEG